MTAQQWAPPLISVVSDDETGRIQRMVERLSIYNVANARHDAYYEGDHLASALGFSVPPSMQNLKTVAGWPGTVVDVLEERLDWQGWKLDGDDAFGLDAIYQDNQLDVDSGMGHLDALIFGLSFVAVGRGNDGEPDVLVTVQSPRSTTGMWDARTRRLTEALAVTGSMDGNDLEVTLYEPHQTSTFSYRNGRWVPIDRDQHKLGRVPLIAMPNRLRGSRETGRSEITSAVEYYSDHAMRTLMAMEVHREFYQAPQRYGLNIDPSMFKDPAGNPISGWSAIQGRMLMVPPTDDGSTPTLGQFQPASPAPYIDQVKITAQLLAAEAGIPSSYLGFVTENPSSADAIRAGETRLVKRAERRQSVFGRAWLEVGKMALLVRDGAVPADFGRVEAKWQPASTPTRAAAADEASKLVAAGVLPPDSSVTFDRVGFTPAEQRTLKADLRRQRARATLASLVAPDAVAG